LLELEFPHGFKARLDPFLYHPSLPNSCHRTPIAGPCPPPLLISYLLVPLVVSFLATPLTIRGIAILNSPHTTSSPVTSSSTKMCFPLLAPPHLQISTPFLSLIRLPLHPGTPPRAVARTTCDLDASARASSRGPVDHASATRGPVDHASATSVPVDERDSLRQFRPRQPPLSAPLPRHPRI
jgi:hypothetical protein